MDAGNIDLPPDLAACHTLIGQLRVENARHQESLAVRDQKLVELQETIVEQQVTIDRQQADLALLKRSLFGSRRERFLDDPRQGVLFDAAEFPAAAPSSVLPDHEKPTPKIRRTSRGRQRRVFPEFIPRTPVQHKLSDAEIPEDLRTDPRAKRFFKKTSEQLEYQPAKLTVIEHYQEVIALEEETAETKFITAPKPQQLIESYAGPGLLAYLATSRFGDHLPYYRQEDILSRIGFRITRSTQWRWTFAIAEAVQPLADLMRNISLKSLILGVDETPVKMLSLSQGSRKSYLWGTVGDGSHPYDCFYFTVDRARAGPEEFLSGFRGYLQSDAYVCYERIALEQKGMHKVACWAHARRNFEEVHFTGPTVRTHTAMGYFQRLYAVEHLARDLDDRQRHEYRQAEAKPIVTSFHHWLLEQYEQERPKSKLRGAIGYMLNRWDAFERYLEHGAIPLDNNRTEASLKYAILGRKAWLFFGNERGGAAAATLFTLTKTCNRHHIDPYAYLRDVFIRLPNLPESQLECLLPDRWIQEHPQYLIQERVAEAIQRAERTRQRRAERRPAA